MGTKKPLCEGSWNKHSENSTQCHGTSARQCNLELLSLKNGKTNLKMRAAHCTLPQQIPHQGLLQLQLRDSDKWRQQTTTWLASQRLTEHEVQSHKYEFSIVLDENTQLLTHNQWSAVPQNQT